MIHLAVIVDVVGLDELDKFNGDQKRDWDEVIVENKEGNEIEEKSAACIVLGYIGVLVTVIFHYQTT